VLPVTAHSAGYSTEIVRSGARSLRTGIYAAPDRFSYSSGYQEVRLPADASSATLSFWWHPLSAEGPLAMGAWVGPDMALAQAVTAGTLPTGVLAGDVQYVVVVDPPSGAILQVLLWTRSDARRWQLASFDLAPALRGRTVRLQFGVYNDGNGLSSAMFVDDVSLSTCPTGASSAQFGP
jgi:hypothetical protein